MLKDLSLLSLRAVLGGYLAGHGAQKLFGSFGGHGLDATGHGFEQMGLSPGKEMATLAGASEFGGGLLIIAGLGGPLGPIAVAGTMATAAGTAHRGKGPFAMTGGPELPLVNLAAAATLATVGPGRLSLDALFHTRVPRTFVALAVAGCAAAAVALINRSIEKEQQDATQPQTPPPNVAPRVESERDLVDAGTGAAP